MPYGPASAVKSPCCLRISCTISGICLLRGCQCTFIPCIVLRPRCGLRNGSNSWHWYSRTVEGRQAQRQRASVCTSERWMCSDHCMLHCVPCRCMPQQSLRKGCAAEHAGAFMNCKNIGTAWAAAETSTKCSHLDGTFKNCCIVVVEQEAYCQQSSDHAIVRCRFQSMTRWHKGDCGAGDQV